MKSNKRLKSYYRSQLNRANAIADYLLDVLQETQAEYAADLALEGNQVIFGQERPDVRQARAELKKADDFCLKLSYKLYGKPPRKKRPIKLIMLQDQDLPF